jgi:murein DD-endopeptidase MepM/ murein hydrolase activator NlpD
MINDRRSSTVPLLALLLCSAALVALGVGFFRVGPPPKVRITAGGPAIGKRTEIRVEASEPRRGLSSLRLELVQGDKTQLLQERNYRPLGLLTFWGSRTESDTLECVAGKATIPWLTEGNAVIRVTAGRAGTWLRSPKPEVQELDLPVRLTPPSLQVRSSRTYVAQGGSEVIVYQVGESTVRDGVRSGNWWFPGYPLPGGGKQDRFALFAVPYDMTEPEVRLVAVDAAGNEAEAAFLDLFFKKSFRSDAINLSASFFEKVVPGIMSRSPGLKDRGSLLDNFLEINTVLRDEDAGELKKMAFASQPRFLWHRPFLRMPNGKAMARFADHRTYWYEGREVDRQVHLGFDLAVTRRSPVPAANDGIVVFAKYFGIYGNAVLIDHGYGLMTLYGHLSAIDVKDGQQVRRGDPIGSTGETGLAGGDHLHFATLLQGLPVNPVEWWDAHWIEDRIASKLGTALRLEP